MASLFGGEGIFNVLPHQCFTKVKEQKMADSEQSSKNWYQSKTVWTGIAGCVAAAGAFFTGDMSSAEAIQTGITSLIGIFLRTGMLN
ncbi:hypothetical protein [Desulfosarcina variabilis]|uniref:hypothetical protein n=1 Tax=Desulfosarcina variabilis TaxID=2300 RepID=UPI003AFA2824